MYEKKDLDIYLCYLFLFFSLGAFNIPREGFISLMLFGVWVISISGNIREWLKRLIIDYRMWALSCFLLCFGVLSLFEANKGLALKYFFNYIRFFAPYLIYQYYALDFNKKKAEKVYNGAVTIFFIWIMWATLYFLRYRGAAAKLAAGSWEKAYIALGGGQWLAYGAALYCVFLTWKILNKEKKMIDLLCWAAALTLIFLVQSTITLILCGVGICLCIADYILRKSVRKTLCALILGVIIIFVIMVCFFYKDIVSWLFSLSQQWALTNSDKILIRLKQIIQILYGESPEETTSSVLRMKAYIESLRVFLSNILWGESLAVGVIPGAGTAGEHSEILDALARWGFIMGGSFCFAFFTPLIKWAKQGNRYILGTVLIAFGILNPIVSFQITMVTLLIIPLYSICENKGENKNGLLCA